MPIDNWKNRRPVIRWTLVFCALVTLYCTYKTFAGEPACADSRVVETIITSAFALAGVVITGYVFGAVMDDKNKLGTKETGDAGN